MSDLAVNAAKAVGALCLSLLPSLVLAQSYETLRASYPGAIETTVTSPTAFVYSVPDLSADVVGQFKQGRAVLAYNKQGDFYAVATQERGHVGYMLLTDLDVPQEAGAAVASRRSPDFRDPSVARTMGLVLPGGGHMYAGEEAVGLALLAASGAGFIGGYALSQQTRDFACDEEGFRCEQTTDYTWLGIGSAVALVFWGYGVFDAPRAAHRQNQRLGLTALLYPTRAGHTPSLALAMRLRW